MNLSTSNSKKPSIWKMLRRNPLIFPLFTCLVLLVSYQVLIWGGIVPPSNGINQRQVNVIKAQRYLYDDRSDLSLVLVGSSMTAGIKANYIGADVTNLAMTGGCSQTGLELAIVKNRKPAKVLIEINETISQKRDNQLLGDIEDTFLYLVRKYLPMFREEYRPVSVLVNSLKNQSKSNRELTETTPVEQEIQNPEFREQFIERMVEGQKETLSPEDEKILREESESIQAQIAELQQDGVQMVLFSFPTEPLLTNTTKRKQIRELMRSLFPSDRFDWLPEPPARNWTTSDGIHLVPSDVKVYAEYIKAQLLSSSF